MSMLSTGRPTRPEQVITRPATLTGAEGLLQHEPLIFELGGWDEEKITLRFWIVGILAGLLGVTLFMASINALR